MFIQGVVGRNIVKQADYLTALAKKSTKPVTLIINSPGGSVYAGLQFINAMIAVQSKGVEINCYVSGMAASMAFQILAFCDERYAMEYSMLLWHPPAYVGSMRVTPRKAGYLKSELVSIEQTLVPKLLKELDIPKKLFVYHYLKETFWTARALVNVAPDFITIVKSVPGLAKVASRNNRMYKPNRFSNCEGFCYGGTK
jgi:ATP-dependent protease ClpP protease subunit